MPRARSASRSVLAPSNATPHALTLTAVRSPTSPWQRSGHKEAAPRRGMAVAVTPPGREGLAWTTRVVGAVAAAVDRRRCATAAPRGRRRRGPTGSDGRRPGGAATSLEEERPGEGLDGPVGTKVGAIQDVGHRAHRGRGGTPRRFAHAQGGRRRAGACQSRSRRPARAIPRAPAGVRVAALAPEGAGADGDRAAW